MESFSLGADYSLLRHILFALTALTCRATANAVIFTNAEQGKNRKLCCYLWANAGEVKAKLRHHAFPLCVQPQTQEGMERERKALGLSADLGAGGTTGGSPASSKRGSTMHGILSEMQSLVERSNIINVSITWF